MTKLSATQQRNAVSEGAALGLLMLGRAEIPYNKVNVDLSFAGAWRTWNYGSRFPQVSTDIVKSSDGARAMLRATERKHTTSLYWESDGRTVRVVRRATWDEVDVAFIASLLAGDVPAAGWQSLAEQFLVRFDR